MQRRVQQTGHCPITKAQDGPVSLAALPAKESGPSTLFSSRPKLAYNAAVTISKRLLSCIAALLAAAACGNSGAASPSPANAPAAEAPPASAPATGEAHATGEGAPALPPSHPPIPGHPTGADPHAPNAETPGPNKAGGLRWETAEPLVPRAPSSRMRAAEYSVAGQAGEAELTVFYFGPGQGGSARANLDRWIGQFSQPDKGDSKQAAKIAERSVGTIKVTTLDLKGTFSGGMSMMQEQPPGPKTGYRVLGAIAEGPQGPVFFKLVGPEATVAGAAEAFEKLLSSIAIEG